MKIRYGFLAACMVALAACSEQQVEPKGDREVSVPERAAVEAAVAAEGCSGGQIKFDQDARQFRVEGAKCADGQFYEILLDESYNPVDRK